LRSSALAATPACREKPSAWARNGLAGAGTGVPGRLRSGAYFVTTRGVKPGKAQDFTREIRQFHTAGADWASQRGSGVS
jgi:hypothetical protein